MKKVTKTTRKIQYKNGDLVFAKVRGFPHWPARVESPPSGKKLAATKYCILFFGTYETATLSYKDLYPYDQFKVKYGTPHKRRFFNQGLKEIQETPAMKPPAPGTIIEEPDEEEEEEKASSDKEDDAEAETNENDLKDEKDDESPKADEKEAKKGKKAKPKKSSAKAKASPKKSKAAKEKKAKPEPKSPAKSSRATKRKAPEEAPEDEKKAEEGTKSKKSKRN